MTVRIVPPKAEKPQEASKQEGETSIVVENKKEVVKATAGTPDNPEESSDDIGAGSLGQCGTVTIKDGASVTATNDRIHGH